MYNTISTVCFRLLDLTCCLGKISSFRAYEEVYVLVTFFNNNLLYKSCNGVFKIILFKLV